jgi:hypothetical protein
MKKLMFCGFILLTSPILLISCGGGAADTEAAASPEEKLKGKWKIVEATGEWAEMNKGTIYSFDGKAFSTAAMGIESKGTITTLSDTAFIVKFDNLENDFPYSYHFEGEKLIIEAGSVGQVFTLEKQ